MVRVLDELELVNDPEHSDVSLTHDSGWCLAVFARGLVVWENDELGDEPRHWVGVERTKVEELWRSVSTGDLATIEREHRRPGYGS